MEAPERIWIDTWGGKWASVAGGTQEVEYIRADLLDAHIGAVLDDWKSRIENLWITADNDREEGYDEGLGAALEELSFVRPAALQALERVRREARVEGMEKALEVLEEEGWLGHSHRRIRALIKAERGKP